jgi:hypothetical protein
LALVVSRSLVAKPATTIAVPVQVRRAEGLQGDVKLELVVPAHVRGVTAVPVLISAGQERAVLTVRFAEQPAGPFNMPLLIRATVQGAAPMAFAETKVEILPAP